MQPSHNFLKCIHQDESVKLQTALDLHSLPEIPSYCRQQPCYEAAKRIAVYAHKLSYTTFAPETVLGQNLFRPPAPQEWDFRASALHGFAGMLRFEVGDKLSRDGINLSSPTSDLSMACTCLTTSIIHCLWKTLGSHILPLFSGDMPHSG